MLYDISSLLQSLVNYFSFLFYELQEGISDFGQFGNWLRSLAGFLPAFMLPLLGSAIGILCFNKFFRMK